MLTPPLTDFNRSASRNPADVPIIRSLYITYAFWSEVLNKFPKTQRHTLGTKCAEYLLHILELTLAAAQTNDGKEKAMNLRQASIKLDMLKLLIRLCKNCNCISNASYLQMESQLQEIGRMLGGWSKSVS